MKATKFRRSILNVLTFVLLLSFATPVLAQTEDANPALSSLKILESQLEKSGTSVLMVV